MRNMGVLLVLLACSASIAVLPSCRQKAASTTGEWAPDLDQAIGQIEEILASETQQQPLNYTSANLASLYDAKLYIVYRQRLHRMPESRKAGFIAEQRVWQRERKAIVQAAGAEFEGGTLAGLAAARADIELTKRRIQIVSEKRNHE